MDSNWLALAGGMLALGGVFALYKSHKTLSTSTVKEKIQPNNALPQVGGRLPVLSSEELITHLQLESIIQSCRDRMGFERSIFSKDCQPVILQVAAWVQLLPASESHHHAQPGGLLTHLVETAHYALRLRQGLLLPVGGPPEEILEKKHRWTYAVFLASMLHDIGKPIADTHVALFKQHKNAGRWHPLAGSMADQQATHYTLSFDVAVKNYDLHQKLPIVLMQRFVPMHVLSWLAQDAELMHELTDYLSGNTLYQGVFKELISKSDSESVKQNLMYGPRTRFTTARSVPLIERLMQALRLMLEEGRLKLNTAGAHGWVFEDKLWFTSKRIADEVRAFISERESGEGLPGKDKNDRLFDTWQEYGALIPTPDHKAVWHIRILLEDGWNQNMTVICFPLDKLYPTPARYPNPMHGRIEVLDTATLTATESPIDLALPASIQHTETPLPEQDHADTTSTEILALQQTIDLSESAATDYGVSVTQDNCDNPLSSDSGFAAEAGATQATPTPPEAIKKTSTALPALNLKKLPQAIKPKDKEAPIETGQVGTSQAEFLESDDSALAEKRQKSGESGLLKPVSPAHQRAFIPRNKSKKPPSDLATQFMRWVQEGIAQGRLAYNRAEALIHFVDEGMMLTSPFIFKYFLLKKYPNTDSQEEKKERESLRTRPGQVDSLAPNVRQIQRDLGACGWAKQIGADKQTVLPFKIVGHDGTGKKDLYGVLISEPINFINPLPDNNPSIVANWDKTE